MADSNDRETLDELYELLKQCRDKAHWLSVHRRMRLAAFIEDGCSMLMRMTYDLSGRLARKESL